MLSTIPSNLSKVPKKDIDNELLRVGMIAELDAVNLYEQLAEMADNKDIKKVFLEIAKEEKTHMGEFESLLLDFDDQQARELINGGKEVKEIKKKG